MKRRIPLLHIVAASVAFSLGILGCSNRDVVRINNIKVTGENWGYDLKGAMAKYEKVDYGEVDGIGVSLTVNTDTEMRLVVMKTRDNRICFIPLRGIGIFGGDNPDGNAAWALDQHSSTLFLTALDIYLQGRRKAPVPPAPYKGSTIQRSVPDKMQPPVVTHP